MIDRTMRDCLSGLVRQYLNEEIKAFEFDEALDEYRTSDDSVVRFVSFQLWCYYDDCNDHLVVLSRREWNYLQRLLLLLESNSTAETRQSWNWSYLQFVALALLAICIGIIIKTGMGSHLLVFFIPLGVGSILISCLRRHPREDDPYEEWTAPFESLNDLQIAYRSTQFHKTKYPPNLAKKMVRSPLNAWCHTVLCYFFWAMLAPIPLLFQCLPYRSSSTVIIPTTVTTL